MTMTIEQAIRILNPDTGIEEIIEIEYYAGFNAKIEVNRAINDACDLACIALEKQIPKAPKVKIINNINYPCCPECGRVLWGKEYYCATCGQRIDRSVL